MADATNPEDPNESKGNSENKEPGSGGATGPEIPKIDGESGQTDTGARAADTATAATDSGDTQSEEPQNPAGGATPSSETNQPGESPKPAEQPAEQPAEEPAEPVKPESNPANNVREAKDGTPMHRHPGYGGDDWMNSWHPVDQKHHSDGKDVTVAMHKKEGLGADGFGQNQELRAKNKEKGNKVLDAVEDTGRTVVSEARRMFGKEQPDEPVVTDENELEEGTEADMPDAGKTPEQIEREGNIKNVGLGLENAAIIGAKVFAQSFGDKIMGGMQAINNMFNAAMSGNPLSVSSQAASAAFGFTDTVNNDIDNLQGKYGINMDASEGTMEGTVLGRAYSKEKEAKMEGAKKAFGAIDRGLQAAGATDIGQMTPDQLQTFYNTINSEADAALDRLNKDADGSVPMTDAERRADTELLAQLSDSIGKVESQAKELKKDERRTAARISKEMTFRRQKAAEQRRIDKEKAKQEWQDTYNSWDKGRRLLADTLGKNVICDENGVPTHRGKRTAAIRMYEDYLEQDDRAKMGGDAMSGIFMEQDPKTGQMVDHRMEVEAALARCKAVDQAHRDRIENQRTAREQAEYDSLDYLDKFLRDNPSLGHPNNSDDYGQIDGRYLTKEMINKMSRRLHEIESNSEKTLGQLKSDPAYVRFNNFYNDLRNKYLMNTVASRINKPENMNLWQSRGITDVEMHQDIAMMEAARKDLLTRHSFELDADPSSLQYSDWNSSDYEAFRDVVDYYDEKYGLRGGKPEEKDKPEDTGESKDPGAGGAPPGAPGGGDPNGSGETANIDPTAWRSSNKIPNRIIAMNQRRLSQDQLNAPPYLSDDFINGLDPELQTYFKDNPMSNRSLSKAGFSMGEINKFVKPYMKRFIESGGQDVDALREMTDNIGARCDENARERLDKYVRRQCDRLRIDPDTAFQNRANPNEAPDMNSILDGLEKLHDQGGLSDREYNTIDQDVNTIWDRARTQQEYLENLGNILPEKAEEPVGEPEEEPVTEETSEETAENPAETDQDPVEEPETVTEEPEEEPVTEETVEEPEKNGNFNQEIYDNLEDPDSKEAYSSISRLSPKEFKERSKSGFFDSVFSPENADYEANRPMRDALKAMGYQPNAQRLLGSGGAYNTYRHLIETGSKFKPDLTNPMHIAALNALTAGRNNKSTFDSDDPYKQFAGKAQSKIAYCMKMRDKAQTPEEKRFYSMVIGMSRISQAMNAINTQYNKGNLDDDSDLVHLYNRFNDSGLWKSALNSMFSAESYSDMDYSPWKSEGADVWSKMANLSPKKIKEIISGAKSDARKERRENPQTNEGIVNKQMSKYTPKSFENLSPEAADKHFSDMVVAAMNSDDPVFAMQKVSSIGFGLYRDKMADKVENMYKDAARELGIGGIASYDARTVGSIDDMIRSMNKEGEITDSVFDAYIRGPAQILSAYKMLIGRDEYLRQNPHYEPTAKDTEEGYNPKRIDMEAKAGSYDLQDLFKQLEGKKGDKTLDSRYASLITTLENNGKDWADSLKNPDAYNSAKAEIERRINRENGFMPDLNTYKALDDMAKADWEAKTKDGLFDYQPIGATKEEQLTNMRDKAIQFARDNNKIVRTKEDDAQSYKLMVDKYQKLMDKWQKKYPTSDGNIDLRRMELKEGYKAVDDLKKFYNYTRLHPLNPNNQKIVDTYMAARDEEFRNSREEKKKRRELDAAQARAKRVKDAERMGVDPDTNLGTYHPFNKLTPDQREIYTTLLRNDWSKNRDQIISQKDKFLDNFHELQREDARVAIKALGFDLDRGVFTKNGEEWLSEFDACYDPNGEEEVGKRHKEWVAQSKKRQNRKSSKYYFPDLPEGVPKRHKDYYQDTSQIKAVIDMATAEELNSKKKPSTKLQNLFNKSPSKLSDMEKVQLGIAKMLGYSVKNRKLVRDDSVFNRNAVLHNIPTEFLYDSSSADGRMSRKELLRDPEVKKLYDKYEKKLNSDKEDVRNNAISDLCKAFYEPSQYLSRNKNTALLASNKRDAALALGINPLNDSYDPEFRDSMFVINDLPPKKSVKSDVKLVRNEVRKSYSEPMSMRDMLRKRMGY